MVNADKLVETLNQALQKAGGEATRVWPDMVAAWRVQSAVNLVECLVLLAAALYCGRACLAFGGAHTSSDDDNLQLLGLFAWIGVLVCAITAVFAFVILVDQVPRIAYPEATLLYSLLTARSGK